MKSSSKLLLSVMVGLLTCEGSSVALHAQSQTKQHSAYVPPPPTIQSAIEQRGIFEASAKGYARSLRALQQVQQNAHNAHKTKLEAEAIREIKYTLALQKIYRVWEDQAKNEIRTGKLALITYGRGSSVYGIGIDFLEKHYSIARVASYGCTLEYKDIAKINGYNETMKTEIERRYGKDFFERVRKREDESYQKRFKQAAMSPSKAKPARHK